LSQEVIEADTINTFKSRLENSTRFGTKKLMLLNPTASIQVQVQDCYRNVRLVCMSITLVSCAWTAILDRVAVFQCTAVGLGQFNAILC